MARSLNKVILIGNLTRDPELRYTPQGTAVCSFGVATNRQWKTETGDTRDEAEFHKLVAWDKLGEICAQMLKKGKRAYFEGRIQSRKWTGQDSVERTSVEIIISDMIMLDAKRSDEIAVPDDLGESSESQVPAAAKPIKKAKKQEEKEESADTADIDDSDIPF